MPGEGRIRLRDLAVESEPLEGVVTAEETATLLEMRATLPLSARDADGRWRAVLDDWRVAGANLVAPLSVRQALDLLQNEARPVQQPSGSRLRDLATNWVTCSVSCRAWSRPMDDVSFRLRRDQPRPLRGNCRHLLKSSWGS